jgi:hypothetical protein
VGGGLLEAGSARELEALAWAAVAVLALVLSGSGGMGEWGGMGGG